MRIAHVMRKYDPEEWGGTETAIHRLVQGLRQHEVDSVVYCPKLETAANKPNWITPDPLARSGCVIKRFKARLPVWGLTPEQKRRQISVGGNLISFELITDLCREEGLSLIHTHALGRLGATALTVARWRRLPLVVTIHGGVLDLPEETRRQLEEAGRGGWEWGKVFGAAFRSRHLLSLADAVLTCNPREADLLREKYPGRNIRVHPHGVPAREYEEDRRLYSRAAFPQTLGKKILLCAGRIDPVKNQRWLVEQMPGVIEREPAAILILAGACTDEAYGAELRRRIGELGLGGRVVLAGALPPCDPRLVGLFQEAAVLLVPSFSETFGLVMLEAWAAGTPVISSRTSGALSLVEHGKNGWLFDPAHPSEYFAALEQVFRAPSAARDAGLAGRELVRSHYDDEALAGRMKCLYEQLIEDSDEICRVA